LFGLLPAAVAFVVRMFIHEPERWTAAASTAAPARVREIFAPGIRKRTVSALIVTFVALITWWTCNAFIQSLVNTLAGAEAVTRGLDASATAALKQSWIKIATLCFNWGGLLGTLLTIPLAKSLGRRTLVRHLLRLLGRGAARHVRARPRVGNPALHVLLHRPHRVRRLRQFHLLSTGAVPDAPAFHRQRLLLQHRPRGDRREGSSR
jgi:hypothetical protein